MVGNTAEGESGNRSNCKVPKAKATAKYGSMKASGTRQNPNPVRHEAMARGIYGGT